MTLREAAIGIWSETQRRLQVDAVIERAVLYREGELLVGNHTYKLGTFRRIVLVAAGKAALPMAQGVVKALDRGLRGDQELQGVVAGPVLPSRGNPRLHYYAGGHPTPNAESQEAAEQTLALLHTLPQVKEGTLVLFLLSGGASSMLEKPLRSDITAEDLTSFYRALVHSGLPIGEMNVLRKHFSSVKGGRLAVAAEGSTLCTLIVSDVPRDALHVVGSGPTLPDPSTVEDCRRLIAVHRQALRLEKNIQDYFADPLLPETPKDNHAAFRASVVLELLSSADLCRTAGELASGLGFFTVVDNYCDEWDYKAAAAYLLDRVSDLRRRNKSVCLISTGEVSVALGARHGCGGRNQQFALECARLAAERGLVVTVLSAGSDGIDGNSPAAGAVADETTKFRAEARQLSVEQTLAEFDSYTLLNALSDTLVTGPTGNNLRDLRLLLMH